jgi:predicted amidohydrolase YtcJ
MTADRGVYRAVAVTDGRITAVSQARDELDAFIGPGTAVIDDPELVLYPAFADTHNHQLQPALTLVGGRPVHDRDGLAGAGLPASRGRCGPATGAPGGGCG